jgi:hypothetical protein
MIRQLGAWIARRTAGRDRADTVRESANLHVGFLLAAVRANHVHCQEHPGEIAVTVVYRDGVAVAACLGCLSLAGSVPVRRGRHLGVAA